MANTYSWSVEQCHRVLETGIIDKVDFSVTAVTEDEVYSVSAQGSVDLDAPQEGNATPYSKLDQDTVVNWIQDKLGGQEKVDGVHLQLDELLQEKRKPTIGTGLPWSKG